MSFTTWVGDVVVNQSGMVLWDNSGTPPFLNAFKTSGSSTVITTGGEPTRQIGALNANDSVGFTCDGTYTSITYTGTKTRFFHIILNELVYNGNDTTVLDVEIVLYKNATFNGNDEVTGGTVISGSRTSVNTIDARYVAGISSSIVELQTNDVIDVAVINNTDTDQIGILNTSFCIVPLTSDPN